MYNRISDKKIQILLHLHRVNDELFLWEYKFHCKKEWTVKRANLTKGHYLYGIPHFKEKRPIFVSQNVPYHTIHHPSYNYVTRYVPN